MTNIASDRHLVRPCQQSGYSLIEVLTVMAILGILLATALPRLDTRRQTTNTVVNSMVADLRFARARAITAGTHHCVHQISADRYQVRRLKDDGNGNWLLDKILKDITLPSHIGFAMGTDTGSHMKFNTRGMQVAYSDPNQVYPLNIDFWDDFGAAHRVSVWPSGQAYEEW